MSLGCKQCTTPRVCFRQNGCALRGIEKRLGETLDTRRCNLQEKRILELQQKVALTPGEARELDMLLGFKWTPREATL